MTETFRFKRGEGSPMAVRFFLALVAAAACAGVARSEGKLASVREEVRGSQSSGKSDKSDSGSDSSSSSDDGDSLCSEIFGPAYAAAFIAITGTPFVIPRMIVQDPDFEFRNPTNPPYGYDEETRWERYRPWAVRALVTESHDFDSVNRVDLGLHFTTSSRFGLDTNWALFSEEIEEGKFDDAAMGQFNFTYRFAQGDVGEFYAGIGARMYADEGLLDGGINFIYAFDIFPCKPMVLSARFEGGNVGDAGVFDSRFTVGAMLKRLQFTTGYRYLLIGDVTLHGPLIGLGVWY